MSSFGEELRRLRLEAGLRQQDVVEALESVVARSTLANVESGRQQPSEVFREAVRTKYPQWTEELDKTLVDSEPKQWPLAGPFHLEQVTYVYSFREAPVPEEIITARRVRAMEDGVTGYVLMQTHDHEVFDVDCEPLWGGTVTRHEQRSVAGRSLHLHRVDFGKTLRRGERYEFAVRTWVGHSDPDTSIALRFSLPVDRAVLRVNFFGQARPQSVWSFGPVPDTVFAPVSVEDGGIPVPGLAEGGLQVEFVKPVRGRVYGASWLW